MTDRGNCSAEKEGKMDWMKELKDRAGVTDEGDIKKMNRILDMLDEDDDVQAVYHNWNMPEEEEED